MSDVDAARAALLDLMPYSMDRGARLLDAFETAVRAEYAFWPRRVADAEAKLAAVRDVLRALWEADVDDGFTVSDNFDESDPLTIDVCAALAATPAEEERT